MTLQEHKEQLFAETLLIAAKVRAAEETAPFLRKKAEEGDDAEKLAAALTLMIIKRDLEHCTSRLEEIKKEIDQLNELKDKDWNEVLKGE